MQSQVLVNLSTALVNNSVFYFIFFKSYIDRRPRLGLAFERLKSRQKDLRKTLFVFRLF